MDRHQTFDRHPYKKVSENQTKIDAILKKQTFGQLDRFRQF